jgi:hypothetical protein
MFMKSNMGVLMNIILETVGHCRLPHPERDWHIAGRLARLFGRQLHRRVYLDRGGASEKRLIWRTIAVALNLRPFTRRMAQRPSAYAVRLGAETSCSMKGDRAMDRKTPWRIYSPAN